MTFLRFNPCKFLSHRHVHNHIFKMNQAYLRHLNEEQKFELTFQYVDQEIKVNRQFNFCRQLSESINTFTQRVATNIEKAIKKKLKNKEQTVEVTLNVNGTPIKEESTLCSDIFANPTNDIILNVCNSEYKVLINSPWVSSVTLPSSILAGFPVYPLKFESVYTEKKLSQFNWYKSLNKTSWDFVGSGFIYNTNNSDIGNYLKLSCIPKNAKLEGPITEAISSVKVEAGPGFCPFETRHKFTNFKCSGDTFRVVSYNILADLYCDADFTREVLHPYCLPYALSIDYRKQLFIKEITGYNADIICLQEVDKKIYNYDLQPIFENLNYDSDFCLKSKMVAEGVACFFDNDRFKKLESFRFILSDELKTNPIFEKIWEKIQKNQQLADRIIDRSSVLQTNVLESLNNEEVLVVGNTHLYFHPDSDHIRLMQGFIVIKLLEKIVTQVKTQTQKRVSLMVCGDFNSVPSCGIYQLFTMGAVSEDHIDFLSKPEESVKLELSQPFRLKSACGTPKYTNFTAGFADCLDYIFFESESMEVSQVVPFPSSEELTQHTALPSILFPSDHIASISDLKFSRTKGV